MMQHRSSNQDMSSVRCELYPECQCDGECDPFDTRPLPDRIIWILAGLVIACLLIALGILAHIAARALS